MRCWAMELEMQKTLDFCSVGLLLQRLFEPLRLQEQRGVVDQPE